MISTNNMIRTKRKLASDAPGPGMAFTEVSLLPPVDISHVREGVVILTSCLLDVVPRREVSNAANGQWQQYPLLDRLAFKAKY